MRAGITLLAVLVSLLVSTTATTVSGHGKQTQVTPESVNNLRTGNDGTRFLKKTTENEFDYLNNEERNAVTDVLKKAQSFLNGNYKTARLFEKTDKQLLKKGLGPDDLTKAANRLEKAGWPKEKIDAFKVAGNRYSTYWWNNGKLDPY